MPSGIENRIRELLNEARIGESSEGNGCLSGQLFRIPEERRSTVRAKGERHRRSCVTRPDEGSGLSSKLQLLGGIPNLGSEGAAGPLLALQTVAGTDGHGLPASVKAEPTARTGGCPKAHPTTWPGSAQTLSEHHRLAYHQRLRRPENSVHRCDSGSVRPYQIPLHTLGFHCSGSDRPDSFPSP